MPIPILTQLIDAFLGSQESIHSVILPDVFSSGGSQNLWIDTYGRAKRILGYAKQNSSAITTNTGGSAVLIRALFPYRKTSGGSTTRQVLAAVDDGGDEWELWYSDDDGATWTFIADLGGTAVDAIPEFGQQGDTLIITNGVHVPRTWNGTALATAGATQSPTITPAAGSSGNLKGHYTWKLISIFAADGSRKAGSDASAVLLLEDERGDLSWTADADTDIGGYELYRTSGTGSVYYYVTTVDGRTTNSYTDNASDGSILENRILEEHGDPPPEGSYYAVAHKQRMWYLRTDTYPQGAWPSDPGLPESVRGSDGAPTLQFSDAETQGDVITGGTGDYEGRLVVWEEKSIWTVGGTGVVVGNIDSWTRTRSNAQTGTVSSRSVARLPAGSRYLDQTGQVQVTNVVTLAYLTPLLDIRIFDGDNDVIISHPKKDQLATINYAHRRKCWALHDTTRSEITWHFPSGSSGECDDAVTFNYRWGVWYQREWPFAHGLVMDTSSDAALILAGSASTSVGGYVYQLWSGHSADGASFLAQWMSKTLHAVNEEGQPAISQVKRYRWTDLLFETEQLVTLTIEWVGGNAPDNAPAEGHITFVPSTATMLSSDGDTVQSSDGDDIAVSQNSTTVRLPLKVERTGRPSQYFHDTGIRLRVYDNAQDGSWSLEAVNLAYQLLEGFKRAPGSRATL